MLGVGCTRELTSEPAPSAKQCLRQSGAFGTVSCTIYCNKTHFPVGKSLRESPGGKLPALISLRETPNYPLVQQIP